MCSTREAHPFHGVNYISFDPVFEELETSKTYPLEKTCSLVPSALEGAWGNRGIERCGEKNPVSLLLNEKDALTHSRVVIDSVLRGGNAAVTQKEKVGITIDKDIAAIREARSDLNFSGLVNNLLRSYFRMGEEGYAVLETRISSLEDQKENLEKELQEIDATLDILKSRLEKKEASSRTQEELLHRFAERVRNGQELTSLNYEYLQQETGLSKDEIDRRITEMTGGDQGVTSESELSRIERSVKTIAHQIRMGKDPDPDAELIQVHAKRCDVEPEYLLERAYEEVEL